METSLEIGAGGMPSGRGRRAPPGGTNTQLCIVVQSLSRAQLFVTPHDCSPASLSFTISWSLLKLMSIELMMPSNHLILSHSHLLILLLSCSAVSDSLWPHGLQHYQTSLSFTISWSLLKLMSIEWMMPSNHLILCRPLLLLPSVFPRVFSSESVLHIRWPKYWSCSFNVSPSNEYSGLTSFRMDWFYLFAAQETLLQHNSQKHQFFSVQLSLRSNSHIHAWPLEKLLPTVFSHSYVYMLPSTYMLASDLFILF